MKCKFCAGRCSLVNDFGDMPIANGFARLEMLDSYRFRLRTFFCEECKLFQLSEQPSPERMFNKNYPFFTGQSKKMTEHFEDLARNKILPLVKNKQNPFVVEIGSNDGTLLENLKSHKIRHLGVDPSESVNLRAKSRGVSYFQSFFNLQSSVDIVKKYGQADVIVAANVICHVSDLEDLFKGVSNLLHSDGVFIFEEPYLGDVIEKVSFDQIYDEHYYIFSVMSILNICKKMGLSLYNVERLDTHGGSMRFFISKDLSKLVESNVQKEYERELTLGLDKFETFSYFEKKCVKKRDAIVSLLEDLNSKDFTVAGYGATSKSTTILNFCNLSKHEIQYICDSTPQKVGCVTPGSNIPVVSTEFMRQNPPDYLILFAWNHEAEIFSKENRHLSKEVKWIKFIPNLEVIQIG